MSIGNYQMGKRSLIINIVLGVLWGISTIGVALSDYSKRFYLDCINVTYT